MPRGGHDIHVSGTHLKATQWLRRVDPTMGHLKGTPWSRGGHDIPMSGTHLKGTHEVVTKGVDPTIKGAFYCETPTLRDHLMGTLQVEAHS